MEKRDLREAARALGTAMNRLVGRGIFARPAGPDEARELSAFTQSLDAPVGDGTHLAAVVSSFSAALAAAGRKKKTS